MSEMFNEHITPEIRKKISNGEYATIFGVNIWSRYDDDRELGEMLWFCKYLNKAGLNEYVNELFYDSKIGQCSIRLADLHDEDVNTSYEIEAIRVLAQLTIDQYEINGVIGHRNPYLSNTLKVTI